MEGRGWGAGIGEESSKRLGRSVLALCYHCVADASLIDIVKSRCIMTMNSGVKSYGRSFLPYLRTTHHTRTSGCFIASCRRTSAGFFPKVGRYSPIPSYPIISYPILSYPISLELLLLLLLLFMLVLLALSYCWCCSLLYCFCYSCCCNSWCWCCLCCCYRHFTFVVVVLLSVFVVVDLTLTHCHIPARVSQEKTQGTVSPFVSCSTIRRFPSD